MFVKYTIEDLVRLSFYGELLAIDMEQGAPIQHLHTCMNSFIHLELGNRGLCSCNGKRLIRKHLFEQGMYR